MSRSGSMGLSAKAVPTAIGSNVSPTKKEIIMWTFAQLEQLPSQNLQTRARDLKDVLSKQAAVPEDFIKACRPNGESKATIQWILQGQCHLLAGLGHTHSPADFGFPAPEPGGIGAEAQIFAGELPSIKKTKESILASGILKAGPNMHDP